MGHPMPPSAGGSLPPSNPSGKGFSAATKRRITSSPTVGRRGAQPLRHRGYDLEMNPRWWLWDGKPYAQPAFS